MEQRLSLVTLGVRDLGRARRFYEALGWQAAGDDGVDGNDDVLFFQAGGMILALWGRAQLADDSTVEDGGGWGGVTLAYNTRSPEEVDAVVEEARAAGATIGREPGPTFWAVTQPCSSTPTGTRGRSPTTRAGRSTPTARPAYAPETGRRQLCSMASNSTREWLVPSERNVAIQRRPGVGKATIRPGRPATLALTDTTGPAGSGMTTTDE